MFVKNITQTPVKIQCGWTEKTVTTTPPIYIPHQEYSWQCRLSAEVPFYAVLFLSFGDDVEFHKFFTEDAKNDLEVHLTFSPFNWKTSDEVTISLYQSIRAAGGGCQVRTENKKLKEQPKDLVTIHLPHDSTVLTGNVIHLATVDAGENVDAKILLIDQTDTESTHKRWRLKSNLRKDISPNLKFLHEGRVTGILKKEDAENL